MYSLKATGLGKKFFHHWVFRNLDFEFGSGQRWLLRGPNGSGKSTLLRILVGQLSHTEGSLTLSKAEKNLDEKEWYRHISWSGPYHDLYTDLTLSEAVDLHFRFKDCLLPHPRLVIEALGLEKHKNKDLKHFSSGMLHRVKVGLAIFSQSGLLFLDEATANMDAENSELIFQILEENLGNRGLLFASNQPEEWGRFDQQLDLGLF